MLEHSAQQKGLTLKLDIQGKLPQTVSGDPTRLRQVLVNLAGNAVKFTEHGSVTIAAKTVQQDENGVTIAFAVADTGIGIRDEDQARIFEPFEQADSSVTRKYGGTGLGLVIARRIVETASRGTHKLTLESREGLGRHSGLQWILHWRSRFLRAHSRSAENVRLHLEHGRPANARALLHDLIGLAGNLGCDALSGASHVLLDEVHHGRMDTLPQFTEVFDRTIEELRTFAETQTEPFGKPMEQTARKLKKLVENYDFSAVQWFEQHGSSLRHTMPPERFARLSEALERYDFERAAKLLDEKEE